MNWYRYEWTNNQGRIIEIPTGNIIALMRNRKSLIALTNKLNSGGGFNGFTPSFMLDQKIQNGHQ